MPLQHRGLRRLRRGSLLLRIFGFGMGRRWRSCGCITGRWASRRVMRRGGAPMRGWVFMGGGGGGRGIFLRRVWGGGFGGGESAGRGGEKKFFSGGGWA